MTETTINMINAKGEAKSLFNLSDLSGFDISNQIILLLSGENPTNLNIRHDICQIKLEISQSTQEKDKILHDEIAFISLINLKYRKSSKSW